MNTVHRYDIIVGGLRVGRLITRNKTMIEVWFHRPKEIPQKRTAHPLRFRTRSEAKAWVRNTAIEFTDKDWVPA